MNNKTPETADDRVFTYIATACGPIIRKHLDDPQVTEIMANPDGGVWIERRGEMLKVIENMPPDDRKRIINMVASAKDTVVNGDAPSVASVMPQQHARFQGIVPPAVPKPAFVIRKHSSFVFTLDDYVESGTLTQKRADYLKQAVLDRKNILVIGGTGSGKTTLSNAFLQIVGKTEHRILTIEDTPELQCEAPNKIELYTTPQYEWSDALKDALRLRPDRIIVGEIRDGAAALNLLSAWNTGHSGGVATIHANSAQSGLTRLETMLATVSRNVPKTLIGDAVDVLVHIRRVTGGRTVDAVVELLGYSESLSTYELQEI